MIRMALCVVVTSAATQMWAAGGATDFSGERGGAMVAVPVASVAADTSRVVDLDEVVVVAQPKENLRLRRQPLSSTVFTDKEMQRLGVHSLSRLRGVRENTPEQLDRAAALLREYFPTVVVN